MVIPQSLSAKISGKFNPAKDFYKTSDEEIFNHADRKRKKKEDLVCAEGQTEAQNNLDVVQLLKRYFTSSFSKNSENGNDCRISD